MRKEHRKEEEKWEKTPTAKLSDAKEKHYYEV
jgi:hypothetical protein